MTRKLAISSAAALAMGFIPSGPAVAAGLVTYTDSTPSSSFGALLGQQFVLGRQWSQTAATVNVSISAATYRSGFDWWITDAIGPAATQANVLYSGTVATAPSSPLNYNATLTTLLTGGNFGAGSYFLIIGNGTGDLEWQNGFSSELALHPAFSLGASFSAFGDNYQSAFAANTRQSIFQITGDFAAVPEPATWAMMVLGFGLAGGAMRGRRRTMVRFRLT